MAHSGGDRMAWGRRWRRDGSITVRVDARRQFMLVSELMARNGVGGGRRRTHRWLIMGEGERG
jgi:hypothetical protein